MLHRYSNDMPAILRYVDSSPGGGIVLLMIRGRFLISVILSGSSGRSVHTWSSHLPTANCLAAQAWSLKIRHAHPLAMFWPRTHGGRALRLKHLSQYVRQHRTCQSRDCTHTFILSIIFREWCWRRLNSSLKARCGKASNSQIWNQE